MQGFAQYADWFYLVGAILFILTLRGLSGPKTAIMGNRYGMAGMALAVLTTFFVAPSPVLGLIIGAMVAGMISSSMVITFILFTVNISSTYSPSIGFSLYLFKSILT